MAKQEECLKCKRVKQSGYGEIKCSYYGRKPQFDNSPCLHFDDADKDKFNPEEQKSHLSASTKTQQIVSSSIDIKEGDSISAKSSQVSEEKTINAVETHQACPYCGEQIKIGAKKCRYCKEWLEEPPLGYAVAQSVAERTIPKEDYNQYEQPKQSVTSAPNPINNVTVTYKPHPSNGVGTAGFILALISLMFSWLPGVGWFVWFLGALLSFIGVFKKPRGLAIVGFIISFIDLIILIAVVGAGVGIINSFFG